ncbi:hypothetical protein ACFL4G_02780 [Thermodesulfobacteriota bacterium]
MGNRLFSLLAIALFFLLPPAASSGEKKHENQLVKEYNILLKDTFPNPQSCSQSVKCGQLQTLIHLICELLAAHISDPEVLQKFEFVASYEGLMCLERNPLPGLAETVSRWKEVLIELDIKAYQTNRFFARPSVLWVVQKSKSLPAKPTQRMLEGYIVRDEGVVHVSPLGEPCAGSKKKCEKVRYVLLKCLVRGLENTATVREFLHAFPPEEANRRVTDYWEMPLDKKTLLIRRNYTLKPLPGYKGTMENYHQMVFRDKQRIVILEQNVRVGRFILRTDNTAVYIKSPPYGVTVALLFTGKYAMEDFFRALIGSKQVEEPVQVLAILRQYIENTEKGVAYAVEAGQKDYNEKQKP